MNLGQTGRHGVGLLAKEVASGGIIPDSLSYKRTIEGVTSSTSKSSTITKSQTSISITDPLVIYRSRVSRGILKPDQSQLRAALEFQKLYYRVKDYVPSQDIQLKIRELVRELEARQVAASGKSMVSEPWFSPKRHKSSSEIIRVLSDEEALLNFPSPHGLLLNGEVGSGKSMLMDIFANSLPYTSKCRWHYSNLMLWIYSEIHRISERRRKTSNHSNHTMISLENEFILFEIAQKMIRKNTVLLLDEFMLPDLAAAKIVKLLFTYFFRLGGVLVATSNRLPEDLYATDFRKKEFTSFLNVLHSRCYSVDMNSENDYRKILSQESSESKSKPYLVLKDDTTKDENYWDNLLKDEIEVDFDKSEQESIIVYGRALKVPWVNNGVVKFHFDEICRGLFGPGDYISLASKYHTFIIDDVPVLKVSMKNEARRFITLLDALYEAKCKLFLRTEVHPDNLFFPDSKLMVEDEAELNRLKVQDEEMFSKTQIALTAPYRPNISYYDDEKIVYNETEKTICVKNFDLSDQNFTNSKAFTGEDEKFAYKRAVSRILEMTSSNRWRASGNWTPIDKSMRPWEGQLANQVEKDIEEIEQLDNSEANQPQHGFLAPIFNSMHFWSLGFWGKGEKLKDGIAKKWIRGNEDLN